MGVELVAFQSHVTHVPRFLGALVGFGIVILGFALTKLGGRLTRVLNGLYANLPGHFQYPQWFIALFGTIALVFGAVIVILSLTLGQ
jgi:hypothetical protein